MALPLMDEFIVSLNKVGSPNIHLMADAVNEPLLNRFKINVENVFAVTRIVYNV